MKKLFYLGVIGILLFELTAIWCIMPFPGSQHFDTVYLAYFLYRWKWIFRCFFYLLLLTGLIRASRLKRVLYIAVLLLCISLPVMINLKLSASSMFRKIEHKEWADKGDNRVDSSKLVLGVNINGEARAYPLQVLAYHHCIFDTLGGRVIMVTYCSVCRTGRVFEPVVNGSQEVFTLVGMDHFNALFEDKTTKSWWRQVNGMAIAGEMSGKSLPEIPFEQLSAGDWLAIYPDGKILQPDINFTQQYAGLENYDNGTANNSLEKKDTASWKDKSWVLGIESGKASRAYDWNLLKRKTYILDDINGRKIIIWLSVSGAGYHAFYLPENLALFGEFKLVSPGNKLINSNCTIAPDGKMKFVHTNQILELKAISASQEFWHSWRTFHPDTEIFKN